MSRRNSNTKTAARAVTLILLLLALSASVLATSGGKWKYSGDANAGCPIGMVCADWEVDGFVETSCCIQPQYVDTTNISACATFRPPPDPKKP